MPNKRHAGLIRSIFIVLLVATEMGAENCSAGLETNLQLLTADDMPTSVALAWRGDTNRILYVRRQGWGDDPLEIHLFADLKLRSHLPPNDRPQMGNRQIDTVWHWRREAERLHFEIQPAEDLKLSLKGEAWTKDSSLHVDAFLNDPRQIHLEAVDFSISTRLMAGFKEARPEQLLYYPADGLARKAMAQLDMRGAANRSDPKNFYLVMDGLGSARYLPRFSVADNSGRREIDVRLFPCAAFMANLEIQRYGATMRWNAKPGQDVQFHWEIDFKDLLGEEGHAKP